MTSTNMRLPPAGLPRRVIEAADRVIALRPAATPAAQAFALAIYHGLARGRPLRREALATQLGLPTRSVVATLTTWSSLIEFDERRSIVGFGGLSIRRTPHELRTDGVPLYAWCAWDCLFLPSILGTTAEVSARAPGDRVVHLIVDSKAVRNADPASACLSFPIPEAAAIERDVRAAFCCNALFFPHRDAARAWIDDRTDIAVLSLEEGFALGQRKNAKQLGAVLHHRGPLPSHL